MNHNIIISTIDALLLAQVLYEDNFDNDIDKNIANEMRKKIINVVAKDLERKENERI